MYTSIIINYSNYTFTVLFCLKKKERCSGVRLGAVQQDPFSALLAHQAAVLLHLHLVAGGSAPAAVGGVGHDGPPVEHQRPAHVLQHASIPWATQEGAKHYTRN